MLVQNLAELTHVTLYMISVKVKTQRPFLEREKHQISQACSGEDSDLELRKRESEGLDRNFSWC